MRAPVLHSANPCIRIARALPVLVGPLLLPLAVEPRQLLPRRILHPRGFGQTPQIFFVALAVIPPYNAFSAALASKVVASIDTVCPRINPSFTRTRSTHRNTAL